VLNEVMTVAEAARRWGLTTAALRRAIKEARLKAVRSNGTWLLQHADMAATYGPEPAQDGGKGTSL